MKFVFEMDEVIIYMSNASLDILTSKSGFPRKTNFHDKEKKENINLSEPCCSIESLMSKSKHVEKTIGLCYSIERNVYTYAWLVYFLHILSYRLCE